MTLALGHADTFPPLVCSSILISTSLPPQREDSHLESLLAKTPSKGFNKRLQPFTKTMTVPKRTASLLALIALALMGAFPHFVRDGCHDHHSTTCVLPSGSSELGAQATLHSP